ncbi:MAG TPA: hypothetical protein VM577_10610, partial [Anaerovoracaceae bacterium]|nr:hypothetical protein [Anaerovoracaceae bacterium]
MENEEIKDEFSGENLREETYNTENSMEHTTPNPENGVEEKIAAPGYSAAAPKKSKKYGRKVIAVILIVLLSAGAGFGG